MAQLMKISSEWYIGVKTEDLVFLLDVAMEKAELTPDATEKELWRIRLHGIESELLRRQDLQESLEI